MSVKNIRCNYIHDLNIDYEEYIVEYIHSSKEVPDEVKEKIIKVIKDFKTSDEFYR